jgi:hypothetical protein
MPTDTCPRKTSCETIPALRGVHRPFRLRAVDTPAFWNAAVSSHTPLLQARLVINLIADGDGNHKKSTSRCAESRQNLRPLAHFLYLTNVQYYV